MRVKLFTHTDLDGVGCYVVAKHVYENVDVEYCNYDEINEKVKSYLSNRDFLDYDLTLITDISIDEVNADVINYQYNLGNKFKLLDHHPTADWLNKYEWATVNPLHEDDTKSSGTTMLYDYLNHPRKVHEFAEKVRRYDTWEWATHYNDTHAKQLNDLLYLIGREAFVVRFINNPTIEFGNTEKTILELEQTKIENYISQKTKELKCVSILNYQAGVVFAEQYQSVLGNELAKKFDYLDFIVMINPARGTISYRGIKNDIDLGKNVAKVFGGGGHPKAAGSQIEDTLINDFINSIFTK
jgi:oligoribonuclease NrnB/cAMP/cGMP phosphodiesterase (DHH superfamily)